MTKICDECDRPMVRRKSAKGEFYGCSGYPACKNIVDISDSEKQPTTKVESVHIKNETKHDIILTRTEKPHSFEFGKATMRHKIYYSEINELVDHIESLCEAGLAEPIIVGLVDEIKPQDFKG